MTTVASRAQRPGRRRRRGQSMVEFSLVAPVLFLFIFGVIDFGRYYTANSSVLEASRAGSRYAAVHPTSWSAIQSTTIAAAPSERISTGNITIKYYVATGTGLTQCGHIDPGPTFDGDNGYSQGTCVIPGSYVEVAVTETWTMLTPVIQDMVGSSVSISQTTRLMEEQ